MGRNKKTRHAGRPHDPNAKRQQTTVEGRRSDRPNCECCGNPKSLTVRKRLEGVGDAATGLDFPLDVLEMLRLITREERDEGLRFAQLAWWLYGLPVAGPELLYERIVSGFIDVDLAPRRELHIAIEDPDAAREELERIERNKARFERSMTALRKAAPRDLVLLAVKRATQLLVVPEFAKRVGTDACTVEHWYDFARLKRGLRLLVALRDSEDRHWRRRRSRPVNISSA